MKLITAHDLITGEVVYLAEGGAWRPDLKSAAAFADDDAAIKMKAADPTRVTNVYLISAEGPGAPAARERLRELIRASGPTVRRDLGKQAS